MTFRLSLQYHPDKNKNKGAQEKFAEINNGKLNVASFIPYMALPLQENNLTSWGKKI